MSSITSVEPICIECTVAASATVAASCNDLPAFRQPLLSAFGDRLGNATLKQADDQSLAALTAFRDILERQPELRSATSGWGLVAAPRNPGRKRMIESMAKFREAGAWSVSPHIIPHCTLHSLAGILSQVLGLHGPNMGAGGRPNSEAEAFTIAAAWLALERLPAVWVVLTGWDSESSANGAAVCRAVVLGLATAAENAQLRPRLTIQPATAHAKARLPLSLEALCAALASSSAGCWQLGNAGSLTLQPAAQCMEAAA